MRWAPAARSCRTSIRKWRSPRVSGQSGVSPLANRRLQRNGHTGWRREFKEEDQRRSLPGRGNGITEKEWPRTTILATATPGLKIHGPRRPYRHPAETAECYYCIDLYMFFNFQWSPLSSFESLNRRHEKACWSNFPHANGRALLRKSGVNLQLTFWRRLPEKLISWQSHRHR